MFPTTTIRNNPIPQSPLPEPQLAELLSHHYGDGFVYLVSAGLEALYKLAIKEGYLSDDGYLTRKGRTLLASYHYT